MALPTDTASITHGIQLAIAPVFLLTAVSGMIGAVAARLARIIDRARRVEEGMRASSDDAVLQRGYAELAQLRFRGRLANASIALLTLCALCIGLTIVLLFLGEAVEFRSNVAAVYSFLSGVVCFLLALLAFLWETFVATKLLDFHLLR